MAAVKVGDRKKLAQVLATYSEPTVHREKPPRRLFSLQIAPKNLVQLQLEADVEAVLDDPFGEVARGDVALGGGEQDGAERVERLVA